MKQSAEELSYEFTALPNFKEYTFNPLSLRRLNLNEFLLQNYTQRQQGFLSLV